jgi:hypothetical protein
MFGWPVDPAEQLEVNAVQRRLRGWNWMRTMARSRNPVIFNAFGADALRVRFTPFARLENVPTA